MDSCLTITSPKSLLCTVSSIKFDGVPHPKKIRYVRKIGSFQSQIPFYFGPKLLPEMFGHALLPPSPDMDCDRCGECINHGRWGTDLCRGESATPFKRDDAASEPIF